MSAAVALRLAEGLTRTAENFRGLSELIQVLRNDVNDQEKAED